MPRGFRHAASQPDIQAGDEPVAEYLRMSDDLQCYSIDNQADVNRQYAASHHMVIVRSYVDEGRSGLSLSGRSDLQALLKDVEHGQVNYSAVLVFDVSRWGRFQDVDESAYYEFHCRRNGVRVVYCAEPFLNDGSPIGVLEKGLKRYMAAEYSRDLSVKIALGKARLVRMGFRQGGVAGIGLRRQLLDRDGHKKCDLSYKEYKYLQSDRVILIPGPKHERDLVLRIYDQFLNGKSTVAGIAKDLNRLPESERGEITWTRDRVENILTNDKYVGDNVSGKTFTRLRSKTIYNPPETWVRCNGAFQAIVPRSMFDQVPQEKERRVRSFTPQQLVDEVHRLIKAHGFVSTSIINADPFAPSLATFRFHFGGLTRAYEAAGLCPLYHMAHGEIGRSLQAMHPEVVNGIVAGFEQQGAAVKLGNTPGHLIVNNELAIRLVFAKCRRATNGRRRWLLHPPKKRHPYDVLIIARMTTDNKAIRDYYVVPRIDAAVLPSSLFECNSIDFDCYRCDSLNNLYALGQRAQVEEYA